jgi:FAD/FMN-containing dehydrogenase
MDVVVQPSVPWMSLNDQIKDSGLFFPVDPGPSVSDAFPRFQCAAVPPRLVIRISLTARTGQDWRYGRHELQVTTSPTMR